MNPHPQQAGLKIPLPLNPREGVVSPLLSMCTLWSVECGKGTDLGEAKMSGQQTLLLSAKQILGLHLSTSVVRIIIHIL
jgi:hypothetical protein